MLFLRSVGQITWAVLCRIVIAIELFLFILIFGFWMAGHWLRSSHWRRSLKRFFSWKQKIKVHQRSDFAGTSPCSALVKSSENSGNGCYTMEARQAVWDRRSDLEMRLEMLITVYRAQENEFWGLLPECRANDREFFAILGTTGQYGFPPLEEMVLDEIYERFTKHSFQKKFGGLAKQQ